MIKASFLLLPSDTDGPLKVAGDGKIMSSSIANAIRIRTGFLEMPLIDTMPNNEEAPGQALFYC